jgi:hypothetical protein
VQYYAQKSFKYPQKKIVSRNSASINPFLFIKNKQLFTSLEGFSTLEKNALIRYQRAMLPILLGVTALWSIVMAVWRSFCFNSNFLGRVRQPSAENNGEPTGHYYLQMAVTSDQITLQNSLQRAGVP